MARRRRAWLLPFPIAATGWLAGHWLAYRLAPPHPLGHGDAGHGYLGAAPLFVACAITLGLAGLALAVHDGLRGRARARVAAWPVALIPPLGFAAQEHLERLIESGAFPLGAALEPTFLIGLGLQVPLGVGAVLLARSLLLFGHAVGHVARVTIAARPPALAAPRPLRVPSPPMLARVPVLATGSCERAPPLQPSA